MADKKMANLYYNFVCIDTNHRLQSATLVTLKSAEVSDMVTITKLQLKHV